ncbi:hypothetical protein MMC10_010024 [Thelotrema lepadinum]|nr:hypothetical protein [Thelotrema lepadinum]
MRILLLGGSGRTGQLVVAEALERGHSVTALVRDPSSMPPQQNLSAIQGSPLKIADIEHALASSPTNEPVTCIVVTLSARRASDSPFAKVISPPRLLADSHQNLITAMKSHPEITKIVTMSSYGVADSFKEMPWSFRLLFRKSNMAAQFVDHDATDKEVKDSGSNFVLVRPVRLSEGEKKAVIVHGDIGKGLGMFNSISRRSVASFLLNAVESAKYDRRTPVISE